MQKITATASKLSPEMRALRKKLLLHKAELDEAFKWLEADDLDGKDLSSFCEDALGPIERLQQETINLSEMVNPTEDDFDIDLIATGVSREGHDRMDKIKQLVRELAKKSEKGFAREEEILREADARSLMSSEHAKKALELLKRNSTVYEKGGPGTYALLSADDDVTTDRNPW